MKYIILIGDGMADDPIAELGGKTPLEAASTPNMDIIASSGQFGMFATVPEGYPPGSDVANLSIFGYDPRKFYTGRAPLEAASIGVKLNKNDVAFRCNLVTLIHKDGSTVMGDYSSGHIPTDEAGELIKTLDKELSGRGVRFYPGTGYRHLMVWENAPDGVKDIKTTPPHDISDKRTDGCWPKGVGEDTLRKLIEDSWGILKDHPVNIRRAAAGKKPATSIWLWGQGVKPSMPAMNKRFGVEGGIISAVDLMKGIGIYAGLEVIKVPGVTGYLDTNYKGKAEHALSHLEKNDFVCVHVEAPDEAGHNGNLKDKLQAIEDFDREVVGRVLKGAMEGIEDFTILTLCDHPTPVALKTHTSGPVPFALASGDDIRGKKGPGKKFSESGARETGVFFDDSQAFIEEFFGMDELG
ncbi:MAG: cofactor-independent phosphoglycerate mutase [Deltaproteobacteria bacterium]|nr:cofactor-independent phosphoglycerate mutase [Deltaproteobacteria bacterium]